MAGIFFFFLVILSQRRKSSLFEIIFSWHIKEQSWTNNFQWIMWWIYFPFLCPQADWGFLKCVCYSNIFNNYLSQCFSFVFAVPEHAQYPFLQLSIVVFGLGSFGGRGLGISFVTHPGWENSSFAMSLQQIQSWCMMAVCASTLPRPKRCLALACPMRCSALSGWHINKQVEVTQATYYPLSVTSA